jgi:hypothetical protein
MPADISAAELLTLVAKLKVEDSARPAPHSPIYFGGQINRF